MSAARDVGRSLGALALLGIALPANATVTGAALISTALRPRRRTTLEDPRTVMVSGGKMTKALELCRAFHDAGHRVVLVESGKYRLSGHRFSRCVDRFRTVPDPGSPGYAEALMAVVAEEQVDVYVPVCSPASSLPDAEAKALLLDGCEVLHPDAEDVARVDDKARFASAAEELGLRVPDTHRVTSAQQVLDFDFSRSRRPYVLKSIAYDPVHRLDLTHLPLPEGEMAAFVHSLPISEQNPWILQEFLTGQEYCTHGTVRDGRLRVFVCCPSSAFQVNYAVVDKPDIRAWVEHFVAGTGVTGQLSFDFIEADDDGQVYAIECNPRTHSAITLFRGHEDLAAAYLEKPDDDAEVVQPHPDARPTYWIYHEAWRLLTEPDRAARLRTIVEGRDAIFDRTDPLPFLLVHHLQIPSLLLRAVTRGGSWVRIDFNIGKLVEPAGD